MSKKILAVLLGVVAVLVVAGGLVWWFVLRDDAPPPAALPDAPTSAAAAGAGSTAAGAAGSIDGTWTVQQGADVFAGFRVQELFGGDTIKKTAVGRSPAVTGSATFSGPFLSKASFTTDLTKLKSDSGQRDSRIPGILDTATHPNATFEVTQPVRLPGAPTVGQEVDLQVPGTLTVKGVAKPVTVDMKARWNGSSIDVTGSVPIAFADYGITPPNIGFVKVDGNGTMEFVVRLVPAT